MGFIAYLLRSANICWLLRSPTSSKNTTGIFSPLSSGLASYACRMAAYLCWPSLIMIGASIGMRSVPMWADSPRPGAGKNNIVPPTDTVMAEKT